MDFSAKCAKGDKVRTAVTATFLLAHCTRLRKVESYFHLPRTDLKIERHIIGLLKPGSRTVRRPPNKLIRPLGVARRNPPDVHADNHSKDFIPCSQSKYRSYWPTLHGATQPTITAPINIGGKLSGNTEVVNRSVEARVHAKLTAMLIVQCRIAADGGNRPDRNRKIQAFVFDNKRRHESWHRNYDVSRSAIRHSARVRGAVRSVNVQSYIVGAPVSG